MLGGRGHDHDPTQHVDEDEESGEGGGGAAADADSIELIKERIEHEADLYHWTDEQRTAEVRAATESQLGVSGKDAPDFDEPIPKPIICASFLPCLAEEKGVFRAPFVLYGDFSLGEIRREGASNTNPCDARTPPPPSLANR